MTDTSWNIHGPIALLIRGIPGSGKSYLADALCEAIGMDQVVLLDPDATDYDSKEYAAHVEAQRAEGVEEKFFPHRFLLAQARKAVSEQKVIIWNQPFTLQGGFERTMESLRSYAAEFNLEIPILNVEVEIDPLIAKARITERKEQGGHGPSDGRFERFLGEYVTYADLAQDGTIVVQGQDDISVSTIAVLAAARELLQKDD